MLRNFRPAGAPATWGPHCSLHVLKGHVCSREVAAMWTARIPRATAVWILSATVWREQRTWASSPEFCLDPDRIELQTFLAWLDLVRDR